MTKEIVAIISAGLIGATIGVNKAMQNENNDASFVIGVGAMGFAIGAAAAATIDCALAYLGLIGHEKSPLHQPQ